MGLFTSAKNDPKEVRPPRRLVVDDVAVQHSLATIEACQQRTVDLQNQLDAERERFRTVDASTPGAPQLVADAQAQISGLTVILTRAEQEETRARSALQRALADAKARLGREYRGRIKTQLGELESALWHVLDLHDAIHGTIQDALADELDIGISASRYWSVGFPGFPFLRRDEEILTWLRLRSFAPRNCSSREEAERGGK